MSRPTFVYRHAAEPSRGLATAGIFFIKTLMAIPHLVVVGVLQNLAWVLGYVGFWVVAFTGKMPSGIFDLIRISMRWSVRTYGWLIGYTDLYPPFEVDPEYPVNVEMAPPANPSKGWAVAGIFVFPKALALLPHLIVLAFLDLAAAVTVWFGYFVVAFTGALPVGIQNFVAGVVGWNYRVAAWFLGLDDQYPPFTLEAAPTA
ncbi:MAG TPA: DUF4389 domain-containing protein [Acidimicrobiia bacterium]